MVRNFRKASDFVRLLVPLLIIATVFTGCTWYLYPADPVPELILYEDFEYTDFDDQWSFGTSAGYDFNARQRNGRLEVYGPGHYLRSNYQVPTTVTVRLEWSVVNGDALTQVYPAPVTGESDIFIMLDEPGVSIHLSLYQPEPGFLAADILRIRDVFGRDAVDPVMVESTGATRGIFEVRFSMREDLLEVDVSLPELGLASSASAATSGSTDSPITIGMSGLFGNPRSLEELYLYRTPKTIGGLL